jgi:hypothetical protein
MSTAETQAAQATVHDDTSGAYAMALFIAAFAAGYVPKIDTRTPGDLGLKPV